MKIFRTTLVLLMLVALGVLAAQWLASQEHMRDFGRVFVQFGGYDWETDVPRAVISLLLVGFVLWLIWKLVALPFRTWGRYRRKQARARLIEGLDALHAGQWTRAEKLLDKAAEDAEVGAIARVAAVRAADARGDDAAAQRRLDELAARNASAHALLVAERALARQSPAEALAALDAAHVQPLPPRGLALRSEALVALARSGEAYGLLGAMKQQQSLSPARLAVLEIQLAAQSVREAGDANVLAERWESLPKALRNEPPVVAAYAERAAAMRWDDAAIRSLESAIDARWDESLVALYGQLPVGKSDSRRASAQRWLQAHSDSPALLVTLARLARQQGQWPQAQEFLHRALAQGANAEAWEELGESFAAAGDANSAQLSYVNALRVRRGQAAVELPGRDLRQKIFDQAVGEERDEHGLPRLRS